VGVADWPTGSELRGYASIPNDPAALVLLVHGFGEHAGRHAATMGRFAARGIATIAYDHRGHGRSPGKRALVERFEHLVDDSLAMRERITLQFPALPRFLMGDSLGGLLAIRSVQRYGGGLTGVVVVAPALDIAGGIPRGVQRALSALGELLPELPATSLDVTALSRDPSIAAAFLADPLTHHGRVPLRTATEMVAAGRAAFADAGRFALPALILHGTADRIASPGASQRFARAARNDDLMLRLLPGAYHEPFNDPGGEALVDETADWILARAART